MALMVSPNNVRAAIMPMATRPAISPYSIAVAPDLSATSARIVPKATSSALQQIAPRGDQRLVGRRHRIVPQLLRAHPSEPHVLARARQSRPFPAHIEWHQKVKAFVSMTDECQRCEAGGLRRHPEFLVEFADQRRFRGF